MMGAEPGRPNELPTITRIDTARVRPVQSSAGRSFIEPGSPRPNPFGAFHRPNLHVVVLQGIGISETKPLASLNSRMRALAHSTALYVLRARAAGLLCPRSRMTAWGGRRGRYPLQRLWLRQPWRCVTLG